MEKYINILSSDLNTSSLSKERYEGMVYCLVEIYCVALVITSFMLKTHLLFCYSYENEINEAYEIVVK